MNETIVSKTSEYFKKKGIILPKISELCNPHSINRKLFILIFFKFVHNHLNFSVAKPTNAKIIDIIQNLITTVDSGHPFFSK